jgi:PTS system nitrogen regulatory IIA component
MSTMSSDNLAGLDAGLSAQRQAQEEDTVIIPLLRIEAVTPDLGSRTKNSTLRSLVALAQDTGLVYDEDGLLQAIVHREELCSTAMDHGIAIPHPRSPLPYDIAEPILVVARTTQGICFGGSDGRLSNLFFLIASQDDSHHLHVLARLCRMLQDEALIIQLNSAKTGQGMIQLLTERELDVIADTE